jgi:hypothetical protein
MAVHYRKELSSAVRQAGLRLVTLDAGGGIRFQGGCTPQQQMVIIGLIQELMDADESRHMPMVLVDTPADPSFETLTIPGMDQSGDNGTGHQIPASPPPPPAKPATAKPSGSKRR